MNKFRYLLTFLAISPALNAQTVGPSMDNLSETGEMLDGIAAIVNEGVVLKSQVNQQIEAITQRARAQGMQLPPRDVLLEQILEQLIVEEIQKQRAARIGIQISDQMLNTA